LKFFFFENLKTLHIMNLNPSKACSVERAIKNLLLQLMTVEST
jgi:hypothetical protein